MERRDLIMDEIEQLGQILEAIISRYFGMKSKPYTSVNESIAIANVAFLSKANLDVDQLLKTPINRLANYFDKSRFTSRQLEIIADYIADIGKEKLLLNAIDSQQNIQTSIEIYRIVDVLSENYSLKRAQKVSHLKWLLADLL